MRQLLTLFVLVSAAIPLLAQDTSEGPSDEKAKKTYNEAFEKLRKHQANFALDDFKKADKQDNGHCIGCQKMIVKYGIEYADWKAAQNAAQEMVSEAQGDKAIAVAHYELGFVFFQEGIEKHKDDLFSHAHDEFALALKAFAGFPDALLGDGKALAHLKQDDAARAQFQQYVKVRTTNDPARQRALRYISEPELARARMAPAFAVSTLDGQHISMDDLAGKVVLIDFWATWCGPCREAMPHMREIAKKFQGQPLIVLSVSLDSDEQKWKEYIAKNNMTWLHYRDGGFTGPVSNMFGVRAIPHTFTIDADGVLQDEHIGDASIEGKLKKLIARAQEMQASQKPLQ